MFILQPGDLGDLTAVLVWLAAGGGTAVLAWAVSYVAEYIPAWHKLPLAAKFTLPIAASFGLAALADYALGFTDVLAQIQPYWSMLVTAVVGWIGTQYGHEVAKRRGISARAKG